MIATDPRLEVLAEDVRVGDSVGRLSPEETASRLGVRIRHAALGVHVEALTVEGVIVLNEQFRSQGRRRFAFAHEVGHVLIERGSMPWATRRTEERWADWFAHECVFPRHWLHDRRWEQLLLFDDSAERETIGMHLVSARHPSTIIRVDDTVICGACGDRQLFEGCECDFYRSDRQAFESLPCLRPTSEMSVNQLRLFDAEDAAFLDALWRHLVIDRSTNLMTESSSDDPSSARR
jgi:hypothetical protein